MGVGAPARRRRRRAARAPPARGAGCAARPRPASRDPAARPGSAPWSAAARAARRAGRSPSPTRGCPAGRTRASPPRTPNQVGLPGPQAHAPEALLHPELLHRGAHVVVRAHRHAAGDADHVGARRAPAASAARVARRRRRARCTLLTSSAPGALHLGGERVGVRAVDPPGPERLAGARQLVAGHHQRHPRPRARRRASARPTDAATPSSAGPEPRAGAEQQLALAHVLARHAARSSPGSASGTATRSPRLLGALHRHHRVGALGHHRAGGDAHRGARLHRARRKGWPARDSPDDRQLGRGPGHARAKPSIAELSNGGTSSPAASVLGEHPAERPLQRHVLRGERPAPRVEHPLAPGLSRWRAARLTCGHLFSDARCARRAGCRANSGQAPPFSGVGSYCRQGRPVYELIAVS